MAKGSSVLPPNKAALSMKEFIARRDEIAVSAAKMNPQSTMAKAVAVKQQIALPEVAPLSKPVPLKTSAWSLIFEDDFSVADLAAPSSKWLTRFGWGPAIAGEPQYYTSYDKTGGNPSCSKGGYNHVYSQGKLHLTFKSEPGNYEMWHWDQTGNFFTTCEFHKYTSGMIWSKQEFLYGKFEISCTIPHGGKILFPAFWLFGGEPYREIDIFEFEDPLVGRNMLTNFHIHESMDFNRRHKRDSSGLNHYPAATVLPDVDAFHVYAMEWKPNSITWFYDGIPIRRLAGHSPWKAMNLIVNLATAHWRTLPKRIDLPAAMVIDYVRVYRSPDPEFLHSWSNQGNGNLASWALNRTDRYLVGKFSGGARDEVLAIAVNGWSQLIGWDGSAWQFAWGNGGSGKIAAWNMKADDRYVVGDFDGDGRDEILVIAANNGWAHLMRWNGSGWAYVWGNGGNGKVAVWSLNAKDRFVAGDFNGDGRVELMAVAAQGWAHMMRWDGQNWAYAWGNGGNGKIAAWTIGAGDRFVAGRFQGGTQAELLAFSASGWTHVIGWKGGNWHYVWGNNGNGRIGAMPLLASNQYVVADFEGSGVSQLLTLEGGSAQLLRLTGAGWTSAWHNDFGGTIHLWYMKASDRYAAGAFSGGKALLLPASENGWVQLLKFEPLP